MQILVNGAPRELSDDSTVERLLVELGCAPEGVAVAVNLAVVPRSQRVGHRLRPGDRVEIIQAVGGG
jgi:sulfur carrier protein